MSRYHYTECGLPNVWLENIEILTDDSGEETYRLPHIRSLHRAIARAIVDSKAGLTGPFLRFLRTEMEMTQGELATLVHKDSQTVGRWERAETPIDENAQTVIRLVAAEALGLGRLPAAEAARYSVSTGVAPDIRIDGSDPENYRPIPRAA